MCQKSEAISNFFVYIEKVCLFLPLHREKASFLRLIFFICPFFRADWLAAKLAFGCHPNGKNGTAA
jgi:hypothetical protein